MLPPSTWRGTIAQSVVLSCLGQWFEHELRASLKLALTLGRQRYDAMALARRSGKFKRATNLPATGFSVVRIGNRFSVSVRE
jgi:hypothetical protein